MDLRDSSSSSAPNRDSSAGEDDGVLPVTALLAKEAALHFQSRNFSDCFDVLNQLKVKKEGDPKVFFFQIISHMQAFVSLVDAIDQIHFLSLILFLFVYSLSWNFNFILSCFV